MCASGDGAGRRPLVRCEGGLRGTGPVRLTGLRGWCRPAVAPMLLMWTSTRRNDKEQQMASVARVTEISARSDDSFEDAVQVGVGRATETLRNVQSAWVKEQEVVIENGQIAAYEVKLKVTFQLD